MNDEETVPRRVRAVYIGSVPVFSPDHGEINPGDELDVRADEIGARFKRKAKPAKKEE